ncbi:MAG: glycosyltransferase family A protein [Pseudomonadota bacterium]
MKPVTALLTAADPADVLALARALARTGLVEELLLIAPPEAKAGPTTLASLPCEVLPTAEPGSSASLAPLLKGLRTPFLLQIPPVGRLDPHPWALARLVQAATEHRAGLVYGDYLDEKDGALRPHPLADHQPGSLEDRFPLGPWALWSVDALGAACDAHDPLPEGLRWHGWYALRLAVARVAPVVHLPEPLGVLRPLDARASGQRIFDYLTVPREAQVEAEQVCTRHLAGLGALVRGPAEPFTSRAPGYPVEASVVIPVRNRVGTVGDAVQSALSQQAPFAFNVIVVDNHSSDGTTDLLKSRAAADPRLIHVVPARQDLGIGGCWNEAVFHPRCGRYAVQLDSDDLYAGPDTLARMVALLRDEHCGLAVGSYTLVDMALDVLPPGLIDHREWTAENGPNNALRVGGLGAPRAFAIELLRQSPFPNASYGEDYAVALRLSRRWKVGRIFDSLYLCRRWEGNTDADLSPELAARHQRYKDGIRTQEIEARQLGRGR